MNNTISVDAKELGKAAGAAAVEFIYLKLSKKKC